MKRFVLATIFLIVLSNANYAQVDVSDLTPKQQSRIKQILAERKCTCECDMTIATCLVDDPTCETSPELARKVVDEVINETPKIDLKRIDISHLSKEQQVEIYKIFSSNNCTCGCGMTIAKCLVDDPTCDVSPKLAMAEIKRIAPEKSDFTPDASVAKGLKSDQGKWYKEVVGQQLVYIYVGNGYRKKEKIWLCSDGTFQSSGYGGSISSLGSVAFSDGGRHGNWAVNNDILTLAFGNGSTAKYKLSLYDGFLYLDNTRYFRTANDVCK
ncbi:MAG: hypothetical protein ACE1Y1_07180 [Nitrosomonadaceae bacterium]